MRQSKVGDFFIGFLGTVVLDASVYWVLENGSSSGAWIFVAVIANLVLFLAASWKHRTLIALGIAATIIIPLLAFSACVVNLVSGNVH